MRAAPKRPRSEMWIERIGFRVALQLGPEIEPREDLLRAVGERRDARVEARLLEQLRRSAPRRARPSSGSSASAHASAEPTAPPPAMRTSQSRPCAALMRRCPCGARSPATVVGRPRVSTSGSSRVTCTSSSMRMPMPRQRLSTLLSVARDVDAGLDRHDHAGLEQAPMVGDLVVADIVHVEPEPMPRLVHEELPIGLRLHELRHAALEQARVLEAARHGVDGRIVRIVPVVAAGRPWRSPRDSPRARPRRARAAGR